MRLISKSSSLVLWKMIGGTGRITAILSLLLFLNMTGIFASIPDAAGSTDQQAAKSMEEQWGVKVEWIRITANGHLVDFRYRVIDPEKARALVDRSKKSYLVDKASGKVLAVPNTAKVGPLRQTVPNSKPKENRVYFVLFGNAGGLVKVGSLVNVVIGDFKAENLVVQ